MLRQSAEKYFSQNQFINPRLEIEWILRSLLKCNKLDIYLRFEEPLDSRQLAVLRSWIKRRVKNNEPLQYITGTCEFYGRQYIVNSKGIYNYRWGDALIRYYTVNLLDSTIKELKGCLYKHSGIYESRNRFQVLLTKSYSKIRNRLYKNIYEKRLSKLDKLFLGVLN